VIVVMAEYAINRRGATGGVGGGYPPPALENLVTAFSDFGRKYLSNLFQVWEKIS